MLTEDRRDLGMIGPNDKITVYYKIRAADNIIQRDVSPGFPGCGRI